MFLLFNLRIIWINACSIHVLRNGYPFPTQPLDSIPLPELEQQTYHAYRLGSRWVSGLSNLRRTRFIDPTHSSSVSQVRFVPGHSGQWILTVSKTIWDKVTIWDISGDPHKCCEWSVRGALFNGLALNADTASHAIMAISVLTDGDHSVEILGLDSDTNKKFSLRPISSIASTFKPTTLQGDLLAISDDISQTVVMNWRENRSAILQHPQDETDEWQHDNCIQVVFAYKKILVARARSISLFPYPTLHTIPRVYEPVGRHSFGWVDAISVAKNHDSKQLSILVRSESDNPWSLGLHSLDFYTLDLNSGSGLQYPILVAKAQSTRGSLRCRDIILGSCGTAIWIQPQDRAVVGLVSTDEEFPVQLIRTTSGHESLVAAVFPGPLAGPYPDEVTDTRSRTLITNRLNNWTSLDYDENLGRVVLGSSFGRIMILDL